MKINQLFKFLLSISFILVFIINQPATASGLVQIPNSILKASNSATQAVNYIDIQNGQLSYFKGKQNSFYDVVKMTNLAKLKSGFSSPVEIGNPYPLLQHKQIEYYIVVYLIGILTLVGLFCMFIGIIDKKQRTLLIFGIFSTVVLIRSVLTAPYVYTEILMPLTMKAIRIEYVLSIISGYLFMTYLIQLYKGLFNKKVVSFNQIVHALAAAIILFIPLPFMQNTFNVFLATQAFFISYLMKILFTAYKLKLKFALMNIISVLILAGSLVFELLSIYNIVPAVPYVLFAMTIVAIMLAYEFGKFYVKQLSKLNDLNQQLFVMNNTLDELVQKRTDELTLLNIKLKNQAITDGLTGIYNRAYLNEKLEAFYIKAKKNKGTLAVIIFDIDDFKQYNDNNGHLKGDAILSIIVNIVNEKLPPNTIFARFGGEEFVILFYNYPKQQVEDYCETIRATIEAANIEHDSSKFKRVTISLGGQFMSAEDDIKKPIDLLEKADKQLYKAKRTGKNKISFN